VRKQVPRPIQSRRCAHQHDLVQVMLSSAKMATGDGPQTEDFEYSKMDVAQNNHHFSYVSMRAKEKVKRKK